MKYVLALIFIMSITVQLYPQISETKEKTTDATEPVANSNAGISIIPFTSWRFINFGNEDLKYTFDNTKSTTYETNFHIGYFSFGGAATVNDMAFGKVDNVLGYLGFSSFSLKMSQAHMRGTGTWSGDQVGGMKSKFSFDNTIRNYDLIYNGGNDVLEGLKSWYAGISYTRLSMPMEFQVSVHPPNRKYHEDGKSVYDEKFSLESFGITFGFDMLKDKSRRPGLDVFGVSQDRFGIYNTSSLSNAAVSRLIVLNPGYGSPKKNGRSWFPNTPAYLDNESAVGLSWTHVFPEGWIIFAVGYDLIWGLIGGPYETASMGRMGIEGSANMFFRHGIIFRVYGAW